MNRNTKKESANIPAVPDSNVPVAVKAPVEVAKTFYVVALSTPAGWVEVRLESPTEAQRVATQATAQGVYTANIENGIQVFRVSTAKVTGPYKEDEK